MPLSGFGIVGKVVFIWLKATDDLNPNVNGDIAAAARPGKHRLMGQITMIARLEDR